MDVGKLLDVAACAGSLVERGMAPDAAESRASLFANAAGRLPGVDGQDLVALWVPGRIEVLGKHTDYVGGRSLVAATEQGFCIVARKRADATLRMWDAVSGESGEVSVSQDLVPEKGSWENYPSTVARRLARNFGLKHGADVSFASDLPRAAGMSSSSAMIVGFALALMSVNDVYARETYRRNIATVEDLAGYLGTNENGQSYGELVGDRGVGTFGGSEDHTAILCSLSGTLSRYRYAPVTLESRVPWPAGYCFVIGSSGVVAEKTGSAMAQYNRASALASEAIAAWRKGSGTDDLNLAAAIRSAGVDSVRQVLENARPETFTAQEIIRRFEHFVKESDEILPDACLALEAGNLSQFGLCVDQSQVLGAKYLENQTEETLALAQQARALGAVAASAFGAGFGGSVWAMIDEIQADAFARDWRNAYSETYPQRVDSASFFATRPGRSAFELGAAQSRWES